MMARRTPLTISIALAILLGAAPSSTMAQTARVAVAARPLARGIVLADADISYVAAAPAPTSPARMSGNASAMPALDPTTGSDSLVGWTTRRLIAAGEPLRAPAVVPPQLVKSGDLVDVVFQSESVSVTMRGKATRGGALGERVTIRMDGQRKLDGTVIAPGRVRVN
jgi:flagella basal body P-ring formation protein FlgA